MIKLSRLLSFPIFCLVISGAYPQRLLPDDPLMVDPDRLPISKPREVEISQIADFLEATFLRRPGDEIEPAENINTLGEVPDSSWFTNRIAKQPMSVKDLTRGPNEGEGPDLSSPLEVIRAKSQGVTPGFTVRDSRGDVYFIKFDPFRYPQLTTSAEVICTKFFYAFGYHVPENYLAFVRPDQFRVAGTSRITDAMGKKRAMTASDVERVLRRVPRRPDGTIQVVASRALAGDPIGPFRYYGTREDDPNDIFPHQNRRELRGLRLFAAWLNHDDARSINSLDTFISDDEAEDAQGYVRHHLIDFGSCLGSGSVRPQSRRAGNDYILEWSPILKSGLTLGIWDRPWRHVYYPKLAGIGRFESDYFEPEEWKTEYPNPAFERMLPEDAFWAARIISLFTDEIVGQIVRTGQLDSQESESYLVKTLIERRDKIVRRYFSELAPLTHFALQGDRLHFRNPGTELLNAAVTEYRYQWFAYDNSSGAMTPLGAIKSSDTTSVPFPDHGLEWMAVKVATNSPENEAWETPVEVVLRDQSAPRVVSVRRPSPQPPLQIRVKP